MSNSTDPSREVVQRTFRWELLRAISTGVLETAIFTFGVLVAIEIYQSGPAVKSLILGSQSLGLLGSLIVVPLVVLWKRPVTKAASDLNLLSAAGFLIAAIFHDHFACYVGGICLALCATALQIPLQTHWLRQNYPNARRGRLFGMANFVRAGASVVFSLGGGWLLEQDINLFPWLLGGFAVAALLGAVACRKVPDPASVPRKRPGIFQAMRWIWLDRQFAWVLLSAMAMGIGVLMSFALRVDYVANDAFGLEYSETRVALLTSTLPAIARLLTTFFWGMLFDRMNFILLRVILNLLFGASLFLYFWTESFLIIAIGATLGGIARGGGEIVWSLWVTRLAPADHVAEYMSVHTFLTGVRGFLAPFLGFWLAAQLGLQGMVLVCMVFVALAVIILIPFLRTWKEPGVDPPTLPKGPGGAVA